MTRDSVADCGGRVNGSSNLDEKAASRLFWIEDKGKRAGPFSRVAGLQFSPDSAHWACVAWPQNSDPVLVIDGATLPLGVDTSECALLRFETADRLRLVTKAPRVKEVELWFQGSP